MTVGHNDSGNNNRVVIIGAGIGGIATAIRLARNGYSVNVYEKNPQPGGRCGQLIRDGHRFDLGATMMLMPGAYKEVFESLGLDIEECLETITIDPLYKLYFDDGSNIVFTTDTDRMRQQLESIEPGSFEKSVSYLEEGYEFYHLGMERLIGRNFYRLTQFANFSNIGLLMKLKIWLTHSNYIKRFFSHPHLQMAYMFQNIYVGQSPFNAPAFFSMIPAVELAEGSKFPKGGMYSVVQKLIQVAEGLGVKFYYNSPVEKIELVNRRAEGVILSDGNMVKADIVVANADLPYTYRKLLPRGLHSRRLDKMKYSCSAVVFHWGLDKTYPQLGHHSVFLSDSFRTGLDRIFKDKSVDERPSFYIHAPVRTDPTAAPEGGDTLSVIVGAGHVDKEKPQDWKVLCDLTREAVLNRLREAGIEDIKDHIKFEVCYPPAAWESWMNISRGSVFGSLSHSILQMGYFRPHNRHGKYQNLYFTGGSTHPGNGIPLVLLSAKLVSERILREEKMKI
jgi:phytoene desaturase